MSGYKVFFGYIYSVIQTQGLLAWVWRRGRGINREGRVIMSHVAFGEGTWVYQVDQKLI